MRGEPEVEAADIASARGDLSPCAVGDGGGAALRPHLRFTIFDCQDATAPGTEQGAGGRPPFSIYDCFGEILSIENRRKKKKREKNFSHLFSCSTCL